MAGRPAITPLAPPHQNIKWGASEKGATTFSLTTLSITTVGIMSLSIKSYFATLSTNVSMYDAQHNNLPLCWVSCHYAECGVLFNAMLNVIMLSVVMLKVIMLNVIMLSVVRLSVVAPRKTLSKLPDLLHFSIFEWNFLHWLLWVTSPLPGKIVSSLKNFLKYFFNQCWIRKSIKDKKRS